MPSLTIPHNYDPRNYQLPILQALDSGIKRAVCVWHRRAGKDKTAFNIMVKKSLERVGTYFYILPSYAQGKKIIWNGMDKDGFRFIDHCPPEIRETILNQEMMIRLKNGSVIQVVGSDNIDSLMGTNPIGVVFSEYSLQNPEAWDLIRPILDENGGWALFNYTPRGNNHGWELYEMAKANNRWFSQILTVKDTGAVSEAVIDESRQAGMPEDLIQQEYYCSFNAPRSGSYYGHLIEKAVEDKRITVVPWEPSVGVETSWDLGMGDSTSIWFSQTVGKEVRFIDYYEMNGEGLPHYAKYLQSKPYTYTTHNAPHDIAVRELGSGKSRIETAAALGIKFNVAPKLSIDDGIEAVRSLLVNAWFDEVKCKHGILALKNYHKEYDDRNKVFKSHPEHDWSSHASDAMRTRAVTLKTHRTPSRHHYGARSNGSWMGA